MRRIIADGVGDLTAKIFRPQSDDSATPDRLDSRKLDSRQLDSRELPAQKQDTAGPEKESSQNPAGGGSEGKAPLRSLKNCCSLLGPASNTDAGPFSAYGR